MPRKTKAERLSEYEQGFRRAGLPLFIEGYRASTDVFNRVVPLLAFMFLGETLVATSFNFSLLGNVAAAAGGLAILLTAIGIVNRVRGRAFFAIPRSVGRVELAAFVLVPAILPLVFGAEFGVASLTAGANLLLLLLIYAIVGYGMFAIVRWAVGRFFSQLGASLALITRAVPLLMIFAVVLFLTTEMWQVFSDASGAELAILAAIFVGLGSLFLAVRLPREVEEIEREAGKIALDRRQRINVGLVLFVSEALQVLFVAVAVGAFFVVFGVVAVHANVLQQWIGNSGDVIFSFEFAGDRFQLAGELLRVSGAIAAFTGLNFAVAMLTDSTYREEFIDGLNAEMRDSFRARVAYVRLLGGAARA